MVPEFREWPKIPRLNRECIITEKIDGTNGCVVVTADGVFAQSRNMTLIDNDPFGFLAWVTRNADALRATLGEGYHYGEWWGRGIQRNYGLTERRFSLFNVTRWADLPANDYGLATVPVLYRGPFSTGAVENEVENLRLFGSRAVQGFMKPEGVVVWHDAAQHGFKVTLEKDSEWKGKR